MAFIQRRKSATVKIGNVRVGGDATVVVQSMTNTDTADVQGTIRQVAQLAEAGSELVRVTVNNDDAAKALPAIVEGLEKRKDGTSVAHCVTWSRGREFEILLEASRSSTDPLSHRVWKQLLSSFRSDDPPLKGK